MTRFHLLMGVCLITFPLFGAYGEVDLLFVLSYVEQESGHAQSLLPEAIEAIVMQKKPNGKRVEYEFFKQSWP